MLASVSLAALVASAVLSADHLALFGATLPGCGAGGGCHELTSGPLGRVPGTDWPWAFAALSGATAVMGLGLWLVFRWMKWF